MNKNEQEDEEFGKQEYNYVFEFIASKLNMYYQFETRYNNFEGFNLDGFVLEC